MAADHDFDPDAVEGAERMWEWYQEVLSPLERERVTGEAWELTTALLDMYHSVSGWCGDTDPANGKAAFPFVACTVTMMRYGRDEGFRARLGTAAAARNARHLKEGRK